MRETITITPTIPVARLQKLAGRNLNRWINHLIENAVGQDNVAVSRRRAGVRIPNALTARTLNASKLGKSVKTFCNKKELFTDLGL